MKAGSLTVAGTGFLVPGQTTPEARASMGAADRLFHLCTDPVATPWIESLHPAAESLRDAYAEGKPRERTYEEMIERILEPVRRGLRVCVALYGHPGVFVMPSHAAIARAREEGFRAVMLPGISAEDCLFADLEVDPALHGCQSFEATWFLEHGVHWSPRTTLVLWQVGAVGVGTYLEREIWSQEGPRRVAEKLLASFPEDHEVILYEAATLAIFPPRIRRLPLARLAEEPVSVAVTLLVPPLGSPAEPAALEHPAASSGRKGSLIVAGTGYGVDGQVTPETRTCLTRADRVFDRVDEPTREGRVEIILEAVRRGERVCLALQGHPAIGRRTPLEALRRARAEGHAARMLPAISCEDCLVADLGVDPGPRGRLLFDAADFVAQPRTLERRSMLILLRVGAELRLLAERLLESYPPGHVVVVYQMLQPAGTSIDRLPLASLPAATVPPEATLYVPPL